MNNQTFEIKVIDGFRVATVTYHATGEVFTPADWQGSQPRNMSEIADYTWYQVNPTEPSNTDLWKPAILLNGWPRVL